VCARALADIADSSSIETALREDLARGFSNPLASCVCFVRGHRKNQPKPLFQTIVSINCIAVATVVNGACDNKKKGGARRCGTRLSFFNRTIYDYSSSPDGSAPPNNASKLLGAAGCDGALGAPSPLPPRSPPSDDCSSGNARSRTRPFSAASASS